MDIYDSTNANMIKLLSYNLVDFLLTLYDNCVVLINSKDLRSYSDNDLTSVATSIRQTERRKRQHPCRFVIKYSTIFPPSILSNIATTDTTEKTVVLSRDCSSSIIVNCKREFRRSCFVTRERITFAYGYIYIYI